MEVRAKGCRRRRLAANCCFKSPGSCVFYTTKQIQQQALAPSTSSTISSDSLPLDLSELDDIEADKQAWENNLAEATAETNRKFDTTATTPSSRRSTAVGLPAAAAL